ncbi:hypothetical protein VT84_02845 [Gemmata sp. SH-PL17]|nr:hypothetical protein VT84_02845 [Gemmata sp. SH-PL17]
MAAKPFKKQTTVWKLNGKKVAPDTPGAEKITTESAKWYGTVAGRHVPLCRDKQAAERTLRKRETDTALASVGLTNPFAAHRQRPLADHLKDFAAHLRAKGDTEPHIQLTIGRVRGMFDGCNFNRLEDIDSVRASEWLTAIRQPAAVITIPPRATEFTPAQVAGLLGITGAAVRAAIKRQGLTVTGQGKARRYPRATVEALAERVTRGVGPETVNHYVRAVRGFFRWMIRAKRIGANPLESLSLMNAQVDVRRARRELTAEELRNLFTVTRASARTFRGLTGNDRYHLYLVAATTGFRANALASLTPTDFRTTGQNPIVRGSRKPPSGTSRGSCARCGRAACGPGRTGRRSCDTARRRCAPCRLRGASDHGRERTTGTPGNRLGPATVRSRMHRPLGRLVGPARRSCRSAPPGPAHERPGPPAPCGSGSRRWPRLW